MERNYSFLFKAHLEHKDVAVVEDDDCLQCDMEQYVCSYCFFALSSEYRGGVNKAKKKRVVQVVEGGSIYVVGMVMTLGYKAGSNAYTFYYDLQQN